MREGVRIQFAEEKAEGSLVTCEAGRALGGGMVPVGSLAAAWSGEDGIF